MGAATYGASNTSTTSYSIFKPFDHKLKFETVGNLCKESPKLWAVIKAVASLKLCRAFLL